MQTAPRFVTTAELETGLADVLASPADKGTLEAIVIRPGPSERRTPQSATLTVEGGIEGDVWAKGQPLHFPSQVSIMNARILRQIATDDASVCLAGDNLVVDLELSEENAPAGTRLAIGSDVVIEINDLSHTGCSQFQQRYGEEARSFINNKRGTELHLRGRYATIVTGGTINVGDAIRKLPKPA